MKSILLLLLIFLGGQLFSQSQFYDAPEFEQIKRAFHTRDHQLLKSLIKKELNSDTPHALAYYCASMVQINLDSTFINEFSGEQADILRFSVQVSQLNDHSREIFELYKTVDFIDKLDAYTIGTIIQSLESISTKDIEKLTEIALNSHGDYYRIPWITESNGHFGQAQKIMTEMLERDSTSNYPAFKGYFQHATQYFDMGLLDWENYSDIYRTKDYLKIYPNDAMALRNLGHNLKAINKTEEATELYLQSYKSDPFYLNGASLLNAVTCMYSLEQYKRADSLLHTYISTHFSNINLDSKGIQIMVNQLKDAGEKMRARELLAKGIDTYRENYEFKRSLAKIEYDAERYTEALVLYQETSKSQLKSITHHYNAYLECLQQTENFNLLLEEWDDFLHKDGAGNERTYYLFYNYFWNANELDKAITCLNSGLEDYPLSALLLKVRGGVLFEQKKYDLAEKDLRNSINIDPLYTWAINNLLEVLRATGGNEKDELEKLFQLHPNSWVLLEKLIPFIESFDSIAPSRIKDRNIYIYLEDIKNNKMAIEFASQKLAIAKTPLDSLLYADYLLYSCGSFCQNNSIDSFTFDDVYLNSEDYLRLGGNPEMYHLKRAQYFLSQNKEEECLYSCQKAYESNPSNWESYSSSIIKFNDQNAFSHWRKYLEKDLYNYECLEEFTRINTLYPGSTLNAIWSFNQCKFGFPNRYCGEAHYEQALDVLGDPSYNMENYKKSIELGTSARYIRWFNGTREASWDSKKQIDIDKNNYQVTIIDEYGEVSIRQDDPYCGKPIFEQKGQVWIRYGYTDLCDLSNITTSSGISISLTYTEKGLLQHINSSELQNLTIVHNENEDIEIIILDGKDSLIVLYDELGEGISTSTGKKSSLTVTEIFNKTTDIYNFVHSYGISDVSLINPEYSKLEEAYIKGAKRLNNEGKPLSKKIIRNYSNYVAYLSSHSMNNASYTYSALAISDEMLNYLESDIPNRCKSELLCFASYFHRVLRENRRKGVGKDYWESWVRIQQALEREKQNQKRNNSYRKKIDSIQTSFAQFPIELLKSAEWLPKSNLKNKAYWKSKPLESIVPEYDFAKNVINQTYKRANGDVLMALNSGIALKHRGHWTFLYYDAVSKKLTSDHTTIKIQSKITFHQFEENSDGNLFVNTSNGTYQVDNNYRQLTKIEIIDKHYIGDKKCKVIWAEASLILYNDDQINVLSLEGNKYKLDQNISCHFGQDIENISFLGHLENDSINQSVLIASSKKSIYQISINYRDRTNEIQPIVNFNQIDDVCISPILHDQTIFFLSNDQLYKQAYDLAQTNSKITLTPIGHPLEISGNIINNGTNLGFCNVPISDDEDALGVLTDIGVNIYKDDHFVFFKVPLKEGLDRYTKNFYSNNESFGIITKDNFIEYSLSEFLYLDYHPKKMESLPEHGVTLSLINETLYYSSDKSSLITNQISTDDWGTLVSDFDQDHKGRVIFNDYLTIYSALYDSVEQEFVVTNLFTVDPSSPEDFSVLNNFVNKVKVASDGTIWVTTELSVFRYNANMEPKLKEFTYFKDVNEYPAKSLEVFNIIETFNNQIWIINSHEPWNDYEGVELSGGLVKYNKEKDLFEYFEVENPDPDFPWFITSYTQISDDEAIVGTTSGFAYHSISGMKLFSDINNKSYTDILKKHKNLFLGTDGIQFGGFWLFGCADGVIAYNDNQWFFPDRLNQVLPKFSSHGHLGGNKVNSLEVDHLNRLNVSTDLGMLCIDATTIDPFDLLMMSIDINKVIEYYNINKLQREKGRLISSLPDNSSVKKIVDEANLLQKKIDDLQKVKRSYSESFKPKMTKFKTINIDSVNIDIKRFGKKHSELILSLKEKNPVIFQALKIPPLDLARIRNQLEKDECIVQYIPLQNKLVIQLISRDQLIVKEVNIPREKLFEMSMNVSIMLGNLSSTVRGFVSVKKSKAKNNLNLDVLLEQLYFDLLAPIQNELTRYKNKVQIITEGPLNYVPFEALIYTDGQDQPHFALEKFSISYLSSLYMIQLLNQFSKSNINSQLLVGDPQNSLPGARKEVIQIARLVSNPTLLIGNEANVNSFMNSITNKKIIHLATHGAIDRSSMKDSWLKFSDNDLKMSEIYTLNLEKTDLMVLSSCETAIGIDGLETTTLAKAFANAGVQNLIASLWKVKDEATCILMMKFYEEVAAGTSYISALQKAKLYLIQYNNGIYKAPKYWSGFILIGE